MNKSIVSVVGARPQFIKAAAVSRAIKEAHEFSEILVHTGQHYDQNMSDVFFDELEISPPNYNLEIGSDSHGIQTGKMLAAIEEVLLQTHPEWVLVYGDTNSTLAGALAAAKLHIPVAHVEAGLRSYNRRMPEEINRVLTDHVSDLLFAPTETAVANLAKEGFDRKKIHLVGDVMYDVALRYSHRAESVSSILKKLDLRNKEYLLATIHRAENTDNLEKIRMIVESLQSIANEMPVVLPLHPRTRATLEKHGLLQLTQGALKVIPPVGYIDMVMLEKHSALIATDSGGVQKEAYFFRVPCVTMREETEWVELINLGWNRLAPPVDKDTLVTALKSAIGSQGLPAEIYGDGQTAPKVVQTLRELMSSAADPSN
jgi:UDP-GlcNAc3NAcA epimerase